MAAILRDSVVVVVAAVAVAVVRTRPRAIPLAMITMNKILHGFPFLPYMGMRATLLTDDKIHHIAERPAKKHIEIRHIYKSLE